MTEPAVNVVMRTFNCEKGEFVAVHDAHDISLGTDIR